MLEKRFTIKNKLGLHVRPAALLVQITNKHAADVFIARNGNKVNGKSIMGILTLAAGQDSQIILYVSGEDEEIVMGKLAELIENGFGEE